MFFVSLLKRLRSKCRSLFSSHDFSILPIKYSSSKAAVFLVWFLLSLTAVISSVFVLIYFFYYGPLAYVEPAAVVPSETPQDKHHRDLDSDMSRVSSEIESQLKSMFQPQLIMELAAYTDDFGVVDEDRLSDRSKKIIYEDPVWQQVYINFRKDTWQSQERERQSESFDAFHYDPSISPLIIQILERQDANNPSSQQPDQPEDSL